MTTKSKAIKAPKLLFTKSDAVTTLRKRLGMNQLEFWSKIRITQSGGSRYENGRNIPRTVQLLLHLAYAPEDQALALLNHLRASE